LDSRAFTPPYSKASNLVWPKGGQPAPSPGGCENASGYPQI